MLLSVQLEGLVDVVGHPQQRQLTQGGEIAQPKIVRQGSVDPLRGVDVTRGESVAQGLGREIHDLHLVGVAQHGVGDRLALDDPGDLFDDVVERLDVLDVHRRDDVDPGVEQILDVLPTFGVIGARGVGVGQLVDQGHLGVTPQEGPDVHLVELDPAVVHLPTRYLGQALGHPGGHGAPVGLQQSDDDVHAIVLQPLALLEHGTGFADPGGGPEQHPESPTIAHVSPFVGRGPR